MHQTHAWQLAEVHQKLHKSTELYWEVQKDSEVSGDESYIEDHNNSSSAASSGCFTFQYSVDGIVENYRNDLLSPDTFPSEIIIVEANVEK